MPILLTLDLIVITTNIYFAIKFFGVWYTVDNMYAHLILEFPNLLLYSYMSYMNFKSLWKFRNIKCVIENIKSYTWIYILSYLLLIIVGLVEGVSYV